MVMTYHDKAIERNIPNHKRLLLDLLY